MEKDIPGTEIDRKVSVRSLLEEGVRSLRSRRTKRQRESTPAVRWNRLLDIIDR